MFTADDIPVTRQDAEGMRVLNDTLKRLRAHMKRACPSINLEQLAYARDVRAWCAHAFPEFNIYLFTVDCTLSIGALSSAVLDGNVIVVKAPNIKKAYRVAQDGINETQRLAQAYINGERLTGNEGLSIH